MGFLKDLKIFLNLDSSGVEKGVKNAGNSLNNLKGMVGKVGAAVGIAFGVKEIIDFGKEIFSLSAKAEGVRSAFLKLNMPNLLGDLQKATRNTVSEVDLMKSAVQARNFKVPLKDLATYFQFATNRAIETGQSVDYLVDSIIMGIGRKSPLILDNLGINVAEIREEVQRTGTYAEAVGNIIRRESESSGKVMETTATKVANLNAEWLNLKGTLGSLITGAGGNGLGGVSKWLSETNKILKDETIPSFFKLFSIFNFSARKSAVDRQNMIQNNKEQVDAQVKAELMSEKSTENESKKLNVEDERLKLLNKLISKQTDYVNLEGKYTVGNVKKLKLLEQERDSIVEVKNKRLEDARIAEESAADREAEAKKEAIAEAKKRAEIEASKKLAEDNIRLNKASITDYETLIKLNDERYKMASSDTLRNQILKENGALKLQLELLNQSAIRYAEISGKKLKAAPVTGLKSLDRKTIDISGMNTDDLKNATAEFGGELDTITEMAKEFESTMQQSLIGAFGSLAEAIGGVSDLGMAQIVAKLLTPLADMAIAAGTIIITTGTAVEALRTALTSFFGIGAIAAGGILIGVGVAAKAGLSALASGGGGGSSKAASASGGSFVDTNSFYTRQNEIKVTGQLYGKGSDLYAVVETETSRRKRGF